MTRYDLKNQRVRLRGDDGLVHFVRLTSLAWARMYERRDDYRIVALCGNTCLDDGTVVEEPVDCVECIAEGAT